MAQKKIINIDTQNAQKNVSELNQDLKETKNLVNQINGTDVKNVGNNVDVVQDKVKALNDTLQSTNKIDFGRLAGSIGQIGAGIAGGFNIVSSAITLFGNDSEEAQKAVTQLQFYLQQLPLNLFAVAESFTAVNSVLNTFKSPIKAFGKSLLEDIEKLSADNIFKDLASVLKSLFSEDSIEPAVQFFNRFAKLTSQEQLKFRNLFNNSLKNVKLSVEDTKGITEDVINLFKDLSNSSGGVVVSFNAIMNTTSLLNKRLNTLIPILQGTVGLFGVGLVVAITTAVLAVSKYIDKIKELNKASKDNYNHTKELFNVNTKGLSQAQEQITIVETLVRNAKDETNTLEQRRSAIQQLNLLVPEYNATISKEGKLYETNTKAITDYIEELKRVAKAQAAVQLITEKYRTIIEKSSELQLAKSIKEQVDAANEEYKKAVELAQQSASYLKTGILVIDQKVKDSTSKILTKHNIEVANSVEELEHDIEQATKDIEYIYSTFDTNIKFVTKKTGDGGKEVKNAIEKLYLKPLKDVLTINDELSDPSNGFDKRIEYLVKVLAGAQQQIEILNDVMMRFGESSLGLSGQYQNVVSDFSNMFQQMTRIILENGEIGWGSWVDMAASGIASVGTLLNALGDEQDTSNKEGFEAQKKYQISASVMNMLAGILSAWTSAMQLPFPANTILGAANSAMIASLGAVQIAKIKSQQFGGSANVSGNAINSTIIPPVQYSSLVQGAQTEGAIRDTRQYVSVVEIDKVQKRVNVTENESRY